jgi:hypothetical protein
MIALFNSDKVFIGFCENFPDNLNFLKKEIPKEYSNPTKYTWAGTYDDGGFVEIEKLSYINNQKRKVDETLHKYPLEIQMLNIIKQLQILLEANKALYDPSFKQMADEILSLWK